jgi:hypothetical protein
VAIEVTSLDAGDIRVTGPNGFSQQASFVAVDNNSNGSPRSATYRILAPGATWDSTDNGTYSIALLANQVKDTSTNFVAAANLGQFSVSIGQLAPSDRSAPTVSSVNASNLFKNNIKNYDFTLTYSDNIAVDLSSIDDNDILVTGSNGFSQFGKRVSVVNSGNSSTVTYRLAAPLGTWSKADNGVYSILLQPNQIRDGSGNFASAKP